jgi:MoaA/NifB/PqqE/SkfB family radical SAM enzyme
MRGYGVLQIEPTDHCNMRCPMCSPHATPRAAIHGRTPKGFMDLDLFRKIIDDIARDRCEFDHLILQWLGEPTLNRHWLDMLAYATARAGDNFGYFRVDTNALCIEAQEAERLCRIVEEQPNRVVLLVLSLDAATRETYRLVKGADAFDRVTANIGRLLDRRAALDLRRHKLHFQFQFVLQRENAHEARAFIDRWTARLREARQPGAYDEIMIKRVSVAPGGPSQVEADALYDESIARQGIDEADLGFVRIKVWRRRLWRSET